MQSLLYVQYLTKTHGEKSVGKMLSAFADGLDTGPALEKACGVKKADFEKGYREFVAEKVKNTKVGRVARKEMTLKELRAAHKKNPEDLEIAAQFAEVGYTRGATSAKKEALQAAEDILRKEPHNPTAAYVKALSLIADNKANVANTLLEDVVADDNLKDTKPIKLLVTIQLNAKKFAQAARTCERARKLDPHEPSWVILLGVIYQKTEQKDKLLDIYEELAKVDGDDLTPRKELAKHFMEKGDNTEAAKYARMALEIDAADRTCQQILVDSLTALNQKDEANRLKTIFGL
jgi:Flp pilus assembly protein TadD